MRLSAWERNIIRQTVAELLGDEAAVRVFGSRIDDQAKGGDIDLLVEVPTVLRNRAAAASRLEAALQMKLGDQKIDILLVDPATLAEPVHSAAWDEAVPV